jgi:hypothetical protein
MKNKLFGTLKWFFRSQLLITTASAFFFFASLDKIDEAYGYGGPYLVAYGEDGERVRQVSRKEFIRHEVVEGLMMIFFSLIFWGLAAHSLRQSEAEYEKEIKLLKWQLSELEKIGRRVE